MSFFDNLIGVSKFDQQVYTLATLLLSNAATQSCELMISPDKEADSIAAKCGLTSSNPMFKKQRDPAHFVDVAFALFCYPPELAYVITVKMSKFAHDLGFQPFGIIISSIGRITTLYGGGMFTRVSEIRQNVILTELLSNKPIRARKAGEFLARAIIISSKTLAEVRKLYYSTTMDPEVKRILDNELIVIAGPELTHAITKK
jgi:hypothetical protein